MVLLRNTDEKQERSLPRADKVSHSYVVLCIAPTQTKYTKKESLNGGVSSAFLSAWVS